MTTFEGFEPVFGSAQAQFESSTGDEGLLHPFLFCVRARNGDHIQIHVTDFHANTWGCDMSTEFLEDKREGVGIGGELPDFITYMRAAFGSDNVKVVLGGAACDAVSTGAATLSVVGQKARGTPKIWVKLTRLQGMAASDAMGAISVELFKVFQTQAASLATGLEMARAAQLSTTLTQEKARADRLQDHMDALSFTGKKKRRPTLSFADPSLTQTLVTQSTLHQVPSQFATPSLFVAEQSTQDILAGGSSQIGSTARPVTKNGPVGPRIRAAPAIKRPKRRGTVIAVDEDDKDRASLSNFRL